MTLLQPLDVEKIRKDFPVLGIQMNGKPLVYLDNAATTQKPLSVIEVMNDFYHNRYATVNRGVYSLSQQATDACDQVRLKCQKFINAKKTAEIIFTKGTTEGVNLVATGYGRKFLKAGDEVIISAMEHHANLVPWQQVCLEKGAKLQVIPMNDDGELLMEEFQKLLSSKTKIVAVAHISNALGTINPVKEIIRLAHQSGAVIFIDGAQSAAHMKIDVQDLDCDFFAFSGHKTFGPTGIGVLYGKMEHLEAMDPYEFGGDMIKSVTFTETTFAKSPKKFEAGTPPIAQIIGLGPALDYLQTTGFDRIASHEHELLQLATKRLSEIPGIKIIGTASRKASLVSFVADFAHPHDIGTILDQEGIAIRTGQHCAQPVMDRFGVLATARASFAFYNTKEEVNFFADSLKKVKEVFQ
ncbi:MAG: cysteine desulfurase [Candidatus Omnitrophica bacterium]|nr:cysteine desulfurase [Candidatus Omnitrophota bacterium]